MRTLVLVGCGKLKLPHAAPSKDLYIGPLFKKARAYAELVGDEWAILSAKHGLVLPGTVIEPYDETMDQKTKVGRTFWGTTVLTSIRKILPRGERVKCICLASEAYLEFWGMDLDLRDSLTIEKPLEGLGIGERLQFLLAAIEAAPPKAAKPAPGLLF